MEDMIWCSETMCVYAFAFTAAQEPHYPKVRIINDEDVEFEKLHRFQILSNSLAFLFDGFNRGWNKWL